MWPHTVWYNKIVMAKSDVRVFKKKKSVSKNNLGTTLPSANAYSSRKEWERACWKKVKTLKEPLALLTPNERRNLILRIATVERINEGRTYRQITEELWVSKQVISSIKKGTKEGKYQSYWERSKTERRPRPQFSFSAKQPKEERPIGRRVKTKYGDIYL